MGKLFRSMSLKARVLLVVVALLIVGIWGLAARVSSVLQADLEKILVDQLSATVGYIAADLDANLKLHLDIIQEIAATIPTDMLTDTATRRSLLQYLRPSYSIFPHGLFLVDKNGIKVDEYPAGTGNLYDYVDGNEHFRAAMASGQPHHVFPLIGKTPHQSRILLIVPVRDARGTPIGALVTSMSPQDPNFFGFRENPHIGKVVRVVVIARKARIAVSASDTERIFMPVPRTGINPLLDRRIEQQYEGTGISMTSYGLETLSVNRNLKFADWTVIAGIKTEDAFAPIKTLQRQVYLTAILLSIVIAALLRAILARQLAPLKIAADSIRKMSELGQLFMLPLTVERHDEVGLLVSNFNRLVVERNLLYGELQESTLTLKKAQSIASIGSWKLDLSANKFTWSDEAYKIFGVPMGTPLTWKIFLRCILQEDRKAVVQAWKTAHSGKPVDIEHRVNNPDGVRWARQKLEIMQDEAGHPSIVIGTVQEITQSKESEAHIEFLAFHDPLTKLPNRVLAKDRMEVAIAYADREKTKAALLFIDLDNFKLVNDSLGHLIGDALLKAVAQRLRACVRETETVSRHGGDEFLIILSNIDHTDSISIIADKILEQMALPFHIEGLELFTSLSIGLAVYPDDGRDFEVLLKKSDAAMYHSKQAGRNTYRFYGQQMNINAGNSLKTRDGLRHALAHGEFVLHYQPQINVENAETVGVEALIRWNHPKRGLISAAEIIPVAEDSGLIIPIGEWVLQEACRQAVAWHQAGSPEMVVAVNLSAVQFKRGDLEQTVAHALYASGLDPACLELELTESILIQDSDNVLATLKRLKSLGVKLSIDDFGTGYSSLAYLKRFAVDKLKIDKSFIRDLNTDTEGAAIVRAIIQMAHSLNLKTIAEGVEQEQVLTLLHQLECDEVQGAYFAMPMPTEKIDRYFSRHGTFQRRESKSPVE